MKSKQVIGALILSTVLLGVSTYLFSGQALQAKKELKSQQEVATTRKRELEAVTEELNQATTLYEQLSIEKNGQANEDLSKAVDTFFTAYFTYDSSLETDSNASRRTQVEACATKSVIEAYFPISRDEQTSDYGAVVSVIDQIPVVHVRQDTSRQTEAVAQVSFSAKAEGMPSSSSTYLYKIVFDQQKKQLTEVVSLGKVPAVTAGTGN